jgi:predicted enzyme related to lactoylglutathione lyase
MDMGGGTSYTMINVGEGTGGGMMKHPVPGAPSAWLAYALVDDVTAATAKAPRPGQPWSSWSQWCSVPGGRLRQFQFGHIGSSAKLQRSPFRQSLPAAILQDD